MITYAIAGGGFVKVGRSEALPQRVRAIRNGVPFKAELIGHVDGDRERETHEELSRAGLRTRGEWFVDGPSTRRTLRLLGFFDRD